MNSTGNQMYSLMKELFPLHRSLAGEENRKTLLRLKKEIPELQINGIKSETKVYDWVVPKEWKVKEAYLLDPDGKRIIDVQVNNLHLVSYSIPFSGKISLDKLRSKLYYIENLPDAIPYRTSYYRADWGFCLTYNEFKKLKPGEYFVHIETEFLNGELNYGEIYLPGESKKEIIFATYICHPSMANNELSGPMVATFLAKQLKKQKLKYSYRFLFLSETIGAISYIHKHFKDLKTNVLGGYVITCCGDPGEFTYKESIFENHFVDRVARSVLKDNTKAFKQAPFYPAGSDERQFSSPLLNLPIGSVMRTQYAVYPEYHTSLDNLDLVKPSALEETLHIYEKIVNKIEQERIFILTTVGEPQLGKRDLYPKVGGGVSRSDEVNKIMILIAYCNGTRSIQDIAEKFHMKDQELLLTALTLKEKGVLEEVL